MQARIANGSKKNLTFNKSRINGSMEQTRKILVGMVWKAAKTFNVKDYDSKILSFILLRYDNLERFALRKDNLKQFVSYKVIIKQLHHSNAVARILGLLSRIIILSSKKVSQNHPVIEFYHLKAQEVSSKLLSVKSLVNDRAVNTFFDIDEKRPTPSDRNL